MSIEAMADCTVERHFRRSETIGKLAEALAKAQGDVSGAIKDSANPFFHSKYADLASVMDACRQPLSANGLAVMQFPRGGLDFIEVETMLCHSSGEWVAEILKLPASNLGKDGKERFDAQTIGSAITYARRYALAAIVGVCPEDDDGNAAAAGMVKLRDAALVLLGAAADQGDDALNAAWKSLTETQRQAAQTDKAALDALRKRATTRSNGKPVPARKGDAYEN